MATLAMESCGFIGGWLQNQSSSLTGPELNNLKGRPDPKLGCEIHFHSAVFAASTVNTRLPDEV
jgi:hypothetical protein